MNVISAIARVSFFAAFTLLASCGPNHPDPSNAAAFTDRASAQENQGLTVRVSVLSDDETRRYFGGPTSNASVQPVWVQVQNNTDSAVRYLPILTDPTYFAPMEAAQHLHGWFSGKANALVDEVFEARPCGLRRRARSAAGFVYTHEDGGLKFSISDFSARTSLGSSGSWYPSTAFSMPCRAWTSASCIHPTRSKISPSISSAANLRACLVASPPSRQRTRRSLNLVIVGNGVDAIFPSQREDGA
jgi:hypothetical protein